jgi:hypothetical protein
MRNILPLIIGLLLPAPVLAAPAEQCAAHLPFGTPMVSGAPLSMICRAGYVAAVDDQAKVPRWVTYHLTGAHAIGCNKRQDDSHAEEDLPAGRRAEHG